MRTTPISTGGALVVRTLRQAGVKALFALHGAHVDAIYQACVDHGVVLLDMRHEAAVGHAAEGYARTARGLGVAVVTAGAGFTNMLTSMANAHVDRTPVLYIAGAPALGEAETNTLQEGVDQVAMARPISKWARQINRTQDIPRLIAHAIRVAMTPPMGPVFVNIPMDIGMATVPDGEITINGNIMAASRSAPDMEQLAAARALLADAQRPVILAGGDAYYAGANLVALAEATGVPVFSDFAAHGLMPAEHPLYGGTGHKLAYAGAEKPDVVLALGTRFGLFTLGAGAHLFGDARIIHIDSDAAEFGRVRAVDIGIVADAGIVADLLIADPPPLDRARVDHWAATVRNAIAARRERLRAAADAAATPIHPWHAVQVIAAASRDAILVADGAEAYHWLNETVAQATPGGYLTHGHLGCMGIGLGLAIGAQVARPERRILLMTGDGAIGFNIIEFDTLARKQLPVVVVVMNNQSWGASLRFQEVVPSAMHVVGTTLGRARYDRVAAGFGCDGMRVETLEQLGPAIEAAFASRRPTCIDVCIDYAPMPPELGLMMGQAP